MGVRLIQSLCLLMLGIVCYGQDRPQLVGGVLAFPGDSSSIKLSGEWRYFPGKILQPKEAQQQFSTGQIVVLPNAHRDFVGSSVSTDKDYYHGTFVLRLDGVQAQRDLWIGKGNIYTAWKLYMFSQSQAVVEPLLARGQLGEGGLGQASEAIQYAFRERIV